MQPTKVGRLIASDIGLQPVVAKAREISALFHLCVGFLNPPQARLLRSVNLKDGRLVLVAVSPAAAAKLKLLSDGLCKYLSEQGAKVNAVSVRVQPQGSREITTREGREKRISAGGIEALHALYRKLPDSPARRALKTLLDHQLKPAPDETGSRFPPAPPRRDQK